MYLPKYLRSLLRLIIEEEKTFFAKKNVYAYLRSFKRRKSNTTPTTFAGCIREKYHLNLNTYFFT